MVWQNISTKTAGEGPPCYEKNMVLVANKWPDMVPRPVKTPGFGHN